MKEKDQYKLDEAIKTFYQTEPLRQNFAATVADKAFAKQKSYSPVSDKILLVTLFFAVAASLIYGFSLLSEISVTVILMFAMTIAAFIGLSIKEYFVLLKRLSDN